MASQFGLFLAKSSTVTVFRDVDTPSPGFSTTTVSRTKEELGPGWAVDDVYPPLAELRRALLTDEEWAAMSSWEKDVWEMFYRPDWERLACIEQILEDTPPTQRAERHEEILEALRSLGASASISVDHLDDSHAVSVDAASSAVVEEGPEDIHSALTGFITTMTATCSTPCLPRHPVVAPVLVASTPPAPTEYGLDTNSILVEAVPRAMRCEFPAVLAPTVQMQQLYNDSEFFMPTSSQRIASNIHVHRPMPWPSFLDADANGDETRPLPWPSFRVMYNCEFPSVAVRKLSQQCSYGSSSATLGDFMEFSVTAFCGNLFTSIGYIITSDSCHSCEWIKCFSEVLLFLEYSWSASNFEQSAHVYHTTLACLFCTIFGFQWLDMVRSLELKLWSNGSRSITLLAVPLVSGNFAALSCEYLGVDTIDGLGSWIFVGSSVAVSQESSVQISTDHLIAREIAFGVLSTLVWHLLNFFCRSDVSDASYWPGYFVIGVCMHKQHGELLPESVVTRAISHVSASETIPITFQVFAMSLELAINHAADGQRVLCILNHYDLRYLGLWSLATAVLTENVNIFNTDPSAAVMKELVSADAADPSCDVPVLFNMYTSSTFGIVQIMFSASISDEAVRLYQAHFHMCTPSKTRFGPHRCMHGTNAVAVYSNCPDYLHRDLGTNTIGYSNCKDSMIDVNNSAISNHVKELQGVYVSAQMQYGNIASVLSCGLIHLGKLCPNLKFARSAIGRPCLLIPIQSLALKNMESWWSTTCLLTENVTSSEMLVFIVVFGGGHETFQGGRHMPGMDRYMVFLLPWDPGEEDNQNLHPDKTLLIPHKPSEGSGYCSWADRKGRNAHEAVFCESVSELPLHFGWTCLSVFYDSTSVVNTIKKHPLPWDPGGRHMTSLDRHTVLRFPWDPGGAAAAWGQAAFQGGRDVRDPSYTAPWAGTWAIVMGWAYYRMASS